MSVPMSNANLDLEKLIKNKVSIPSPPTVLTQVMAELSSETTNASKLERIIKDCPPNFCRLLTPLIMAFLGESIV